MSFTSRIGQTTQSVTTSFAGRGKGGLRSEAASAFSGTLRESLRSGTTSSGRGQSLTGSRSLNESNVPPATTTEKAAASGKPGTSLRVQSVDAVKKACMDSGMNLANVDFGYNDDMIWNPLGNYRYPQIVVTLPDGDLWTCSAELAQRSPQLAAYELRQRLGYTRA